MSQTPDGKPVAFHDLPDDSFPVRLRMFSPAQSLVWDSGDINDVGIVEIPGLGPGSVRYTITTFGDGQMILRDDPTCSMTVPLDWEVEDLFAHMQHLLYIVKNTARTMIEYNSEMLKSFSAAAEDHAPPPVVKSLITYFEREISLGELMLEGVEETQRLFHAAAEEREG